MEKRPKNFPGKDEKYPWRNKETLEKMSRFCLKCEDLVDDPTLEFCPKCGELLCTQKDAAILWKTRQQTVSQWCRIHNVEWVRRQKQARTGQRPRLGIDWKNLRTRNVTTEEILEVIKSLQDLREKLTIEQEEVSGHIETDCPIGIVCMGDLHIGHMHTDYEKLYKHIKLVLDTPNSYVLLVGDLIENNNLAATVQHQDLHTEDLIPTSMQKRLTEMLLHPLVLKRKIAAIVLGCHDERSKRSDDFDFCDYCAEVANVPYLGYGGKINLRVGQTDYSLVVRHKFPMQSRYNATHANKQMLRFYLDGDISITAHMHEAAVEECYIRGEPKLNIRVAAYKTSDSFGRAKGFNPVKPTSPVVILWPDRKRFIGFRETEAGLDYLKYLNRDRNK